MVGQKFVVQGPRRVPDDLVDVSAVADALVALVLVHDGLALVGAGECVAANADQLQKLSLLREILTEPS